jgi:uncharacterized membrane-anchored protein YitT (DUF2179 family)
MIQQLFSTVLQVTGFLAIIIGLSLWSIPAALIAGGIFATLIGFALGVDK